MAYATDVSDRSDISKQKTQPDGSFKRIDARFRNFIKSDGEFLPEKGQYNQSILIISKGSANV
jgi:putative glutathione S-transferase